MPTGTPLPSAAHQVLDVLAAAEAAIGVGKADLLEHRASHREADAVEPARPERPGHGADERGGMGLEAVVERALGERRADDVEPVALGRVEHRRHRVGAHQDVVVEQHDPVAVGIGEQRALRPGAAAAEVDGIAQRADRRLRGEPLGRRVVAAVVDDEDRLGRRAVPEQALHALLRVVELVENRDDDGVAHRA